MQDCVLVTGPEYQKGKEVFEAETRRQVESAPSDEQGLAQAVRSRRCRAAVVGVEPYTGPLYEALAEVAGEGSALLARYGVGHVNIDSNLAEQHHIVVTNTPGVLTESVAEHALWLMGALARRIVQLDATLRAGYFAPQAGTELQGKTLAVMGFGHIGRRVGMMAHFGIGMKVIAEDDHPLAEQAQREGLTEGEFKQQYGIDEYTMDPAQALRGADVVSLHMTVTPETRGFFNAQRLNAMKPGALLVNTARGQLIDEGALYDAVSSGRLGGAALDVFTKEPYQPVDPAKDLRTLPNLVLTPHVASDTHEANARMAQVCLQNIGHFYAGEWGQLDQVAGYSPAAQPEAAAPSRS